MATSKLSQIIPLGTNPQSSDYIVGVTSSNTVDSLITFTEATQALTTFTSGAQGVVPSSGGGTTNFLRADGTWTTTPAAALTVNSTTITGGSTGNILYDNSGTVGEETLAVTNDTNVTGSWSGANLHLGWTGTLAAGRLNSNVVQGITNDTNVTGTISAQNLTLGWTGTLASGRLNSNVVQSIVNDTNVTGSIATQALTLGWTGTLAVARGGTGGGTASGTLLDNITGFSSTGFIKRTGAGAYSFVSDPSDVTSVSNSDGTLTISPTTGAVVASLALGHANTWSGAQSFNSGKLVLNGSTSGSTTLNASAIASGTLTLPAATDTVAVLGTAQTFSTTQTFSGTLNVSGTFESGGNAMTFPGSAATLLSTNVSQTLSVGHLFTAYSAGTFSSGTFTPSAANGNYQYATNNGAFTLAAPGSDCAIDILITNGASAGTITFSSFTVGSNTGDSLTTTNTNKFIISIRRINGTSTYVIKALQ